MSGTTKYEVNRVVVDKLPPHVRTFVDVKPDGTLKFYFDTPNAKPVQEELVVDMEQARRILGHDVFISSKQPHDSVMELAMQTLKKEPIFISDMSQFYYRGK